MLVYTDLRRVGDRRRIGGSDIEITVSQPFRQDVAMQLCGGTLPIEDPEDLLLSYVEAGGPYAYPAYDTLVTNGSADLVTGDLLAPCLLEAHVDLPRFGVLLRMYPTLRDRLAALPPVALEDADEAAFAAVAHCFDVLDEPQFARAGVRGTIVSKVLHRKRPDLVPLYDSRIWTAHTAPGAVARAAHRTWVDFMVLFCQQIHDDINAHRGDLVALQKAAAAEGADLTLLRIHDILVWMQTAPPV